MYKCMNVNDTNQCHLGMSKTSAIKLVYTIKEIALFHQFRDMW